MLETRIWVPKEVTRDQFRAMDLARDQVRALSPNQEIHDRSVISGTLGDGREGFLVVISHLDPSDPLKTNPGEGTNVTLDDFRNALTLDDFRVGDRVQVHPATDTWMQGDRFGVVIKVAKLVHIKMDRSGRVLRFDPRNIQEVVGR